LESRVTPNFSFRKDLSKTLEDVVKRLAQEPWRNKHLHDIKTTIGQVIQVCVVICDTELQASEIALSLIRAKISRVCVLRDGEPRPHKNPNDNSTKQTNK